VEDSRACDPIHSLNRTPPAVNPLSGYSKPGVAGSGTIACGLAAAASMSGEVRLLARSDSSAWRAEEAAQKLASKLEDARPGHIKVTTEIGELRDCDVIVEAVTEDLQVKGALLRELAAAAPDADLASTTSSLRISDLAAACGQGERLFGLHVFNPVTKMELIELCLPEGLRSGIADRARAWCGALDKVAVEVPDTAGFVVNRLLFPFLFDAVRLLETTDLSAAGVDDCVRLGAAHPMGPLKLLDFVGLDVAEAIGDSIAEESGADSHRPPERLRELVAQGRLGRKSGQGFFEY
jgi:3-hydroxybutyryl-CoA dehydrogenase